ncbi:hypothetical protein D3C72_1064200 [compost metagenome]
MPNGFRPAGRIDNAPARAGNEILQGPDQSALTGGTAAPPFGKSRLHDLGRRGPGHVEIKAAIFATQHVRFDVVEQLQIVIANILEIPGGATIARCAGFPPWIVHGDAGKISVQRFLFGNIGEGEAFGGKAQIGAARIFQRAAIGAHAVIMADPGVGNEGQCTAGRGIGDIGCIWSLLGDEFRQDLLGERSLPYLLWQAEHSALLVHFTAAAENGKRWRKRDRFQELRDFRHDMLAQALVLCRVIEIGEHGILPDHDAKLVAKREEFRCLIGHGAADADHVHARFRGFSKPWLIVRPCSRQAHNIGRRPHRAAAKYLLTVHLEAETVAVFAVIDLDLPEARAPKVMLRAVELKNDVMQSRPAMGMRPPLFDIGYAQFAGKLAALVRRKIGAVTGTAKPCRFYRAVALQHDADRSRSVSVQRRPERAEHSVLPYQADGSPGAGGVDFRAPSGHVTQCSGADQPQALRIHHLRPPAGAGPGFFKSRRKRPEADRKFVCAR